MLADGAVVQFVDPARPDRRYLLDKSVTWHGPEHQWGAGHVITDRLGDVRFVLPSTVDSRPAPTADPLANDQDWHLVYWLRLEHPEAA
ncbi:hypothetical protein Ari01nite_15840 [Paractinoplanes rishiriensis]|uniref:Uncharacterized protein n=1 Tax=Paractinoplanes rishiriensis TaxID=1050105 RepID=A0A919MTC5_9ACTN|nr:hypothetical protein Ari01nite_15840 [Actinoplanes rishiriensis]